MGRKVAWISDIITKDKPWGNERSWSGAGFSHSKIITIESGHRTSLKKYKVKNESFFLVSGKIAVIYGDEKTTSVEFMSHGILLPNQVLSVPSGCPYRLEALEDSVIIETSDYREDDFELIEDDYNR